MNYINYISTELLPKGEGKEEMEEEEGEEVEVEMKEDKRVILNFSFLSN